MVQVLLLSNLRCEKPPYSHPERSEGSPVSEDISINVIHKGVYLRYGRLFAPLRVTIYGVCECW